ncbi:DUF2997 domain-containing protein (plasmid) [Anabaena sp. FACHB-709]|uniref:DUF2997 domain-containing protein n=1 Tax=Trichormus variabilis NIES-23 TaxID=1973479 RepID=A0A1Z4KV16_ANAVA|nr:MULTISPECIES: DUF2997 domain-containing protein [Nostocaceae]BAY72768.1 hypothetical protein NIES23_55960 [Trichormus variabilis NIES-23]MBD2266645.1 DUF2997 domain-containing protein [Anabaena sp. FACHB-709]MBD2276261.1 DUF2997 domain-containing protein [Nostoc sp. PCC 7120 = FACHB-418]MBD2352709.1 DUF2997 domain-containing protein [Trichormus variabilis FACHB-171]RUR76138.1 hypothetical protein DSM107007_47250 [Nostoc sp. PCC 7120 = FACHB-418]
MERSILIHFDNKTGSVRVEALGFEGLSCLEATQPFEEALGVVEGEREFKPEAQSQQLRTNNNHQTRLRQ